MPHTDAPTAPRPILLALVARIPPLGIPAFNAYEDRVLPLLDAHGGILQRRLRTEDGAVEIHLVWFPSQAAFDAFRQDPRRAEHAPLMLASGAATELLPVADVVSGTPHLAAEAGSGDTA